MIVAARVVAVVLAVLTCAADASAAADESAGKKQQIAELVALHDLTTSVSNVGHTVSTHVITTLSFSGELKDIPGVQDERNRIQHIWNREDDDMRFSIEDATNAEGPRFAYSALGKKYFVTAILKLTGIINRRIDELAVALPKEVNARADQVRPLLQEFKSGRG